MTINNHFLIRNYLQKIFKCEGAKLGFVRSGICEHKGVERKGLEASFENAN
jgi:hypothetical protein